MAGLDLLARGEPAFGDRQPGGGEDLLRLHLVHGHGGRHDPGMRVGNFEPLQQALDAAVLAPAAMKGVEHHVGAGLGQARGQVGARGA